MYNSIPPTQSPTHHRHHHHLQPLVMSECCSCETQRGEDGDQPMNKSTVYFSDEASSCLSGETQRSNAVAFNSGTFIWTLHDYIGEWCV